MISKLKPVFYNLFHSHNLNFCLYLCLKWLCKSQFLFGFVSYFTYPFEFGLVGLLYLDKFPVCRYEFPKSLLGWLLPVKFGFYVTCAVKLRDEGKETDENWYSPKKGERD